ncbi:MAG: DMT family transporter [Ruminococcaceae bacterium]|nr:DMT family transporter [Oscillospiraceae bacterium]
MKSKWIRQVVFPLVAAIIWGTAFVFQSEGAAYVGPFTFNTMRCAMATVFLGLILLGRDLWQKRKPRAADDAPKDKRNVKALLLGGLLCGAMLACASNLQQLGLGATSPGKAAFITALYVVLVPVFGLFLGKRARPVVWIGVALAVAGLYFLCITGKMSVERSDFFVFLCALCFAVHIMIIDRFSPHVNGVELSCVQFAVVTVVSAIGMLLTEAPTWAAISACLWPLFYVGVFSGGVAYTLQILAQKNANPTVVSLLLCLESVFAVLAEGLMMAQWPSVREWIGCGLMLTAVVLAQLPEGKGRKE